MEEFLASWEANKNAEAARLSGLEADIVSILGAISRRLASLPSPADYLALEQDLASGNKTMDTLMADHAQLALYLNKVRCFQLWNVELYYCQTFNKIILRRNLKVETNFFNIQFRSVEILNQQVSSIVVVRRDLMF